jgi:hypothetical protein
MWSGFGGPDGHCGEEAYGEYIEGETFRNGWTGEVFRRDFKYLGLPGQMSCPKHGGPEKTGPRVFEDGLSKYGRAMYCAVMHDFTNLQECPAGFDERPWVAIQKLRAKLRAEQTNG